MGRRSPKSSSAIEQIQNEYFRKIGIFPQLFRGTSMGAAEFGHVRINT
jgi:hypothetical protein